MVRVPLFVLNAFRHQRKKRKPYAEQRTHSYIVLNAFRHQRKKRGKKQLAPAAVDKCSTPSGIKGRNALGEVQAFQAGVGVLNAFRHQRKKRGMMLCVSTGDRMCSTPSGIKGRNAR